MNDKLMRGKTLDKGRNYQESRLYFNEVSLSTKVNLRLYYFYLLSLLFQEHNTVLEFTFITKCMNEEIKSKFGYMKKEKSLAPDVIVMNSCLWDISRFV